MILSPGDARGKLILVGMYLSKYDSAGLRRLGFGGISEACNVIGFALGANPMSLKNYRDEFDPLFPNRRKGWRNRPLREHCREVYDRYNHLDFEEFSRLIVTVVDPNSALDDPTDEAAESGDSDDGSAFARRLITGRAAENYFSRVQPTIPQFADYALEDTTLQGCGYDFRLSAKGIRDFLAVEVKGLSANTGSLLLTPREHAAARYLRGRFYLFVVKNFQRTPFHELYPDPLSGDLEVKRLERIVVQVSWTVRV